MGFHNHQVSPEGNVPRVGRQRWLLWTRMRPIKLKLQVKRGSSDLSTLVVWLKIGDRPVVMTFVLAIWIVHIYIYNHWSIFRWWTATLIKHWILGYTIFRHSQIDFRLFLDNFGSALFRAWHDRSDFAMFIHSFILLSSNDMIILPIYFTARSIGLGDVGRDLRPRFCRNGSNGSPWAGDTMWHWSRRQSLAAKGSGEGATRSSGQHSWDLAGHTGVKAETCSGCSAAKENQGDRYHLW